MVVLFLAGGVDELRAGRRRRRLAWERAGLFAPGPDHLKGLDLGELGDRDVFLTGFRIHRPDDDRFTLAWADPEKNSADLSWGGSRWG